MNAKASVALVIFCFFSLLLAQNQNDYRTFQSGDWFSPETWEVYTGDSWVLSASIPDAATSNQIRICTGHTISVSDNITIDQMLVEAGGAINLASNKTITVNDGVGVDLVVDGILRINGDANQNSIGVTGIGKVQITGDCYWYSGGITNTDFWITPTGTMHIQGSANKIMRLQARIYNLGTVLHYDGGGTFIGVGNSIFDNLEGGVYHAMGSCSIRYEYAYDWYDQYTFNNYGNIIKSNEDTTLTLFRGTFNNYGSIQLLAGTLLLSGSSTRTSSGPIDIAEGAILKVADSSSLNLNEGTLISGGGTLLLHQSNTNAVLRVYSGIEGIPISEETIVDFVQGTIGGTGRLNIAGEMLWQGGRIDGPVIELGTTAILRIQSGAEKRIARSTLDNYGQVLHESAETLSSSNGTILNNHNGAIWDIAQSGTIQYRSDLGSPRTILNNYGTMQNSVDALTTTLNRVEFNNSGQCLVQGGVLRLNSYGSGINSGSVHISDDSAFNVETNFTWTMAEGSVVQGSGVFKLDGGKLLQSGMTEGATIGSDIDFQMTGGQIGGTGKLNILCDMLWSGGEIMCENFIISENSTVLGTGATADLKTSGFGYITNHGYICITASVGSGNITYVNLEGAILEFGQGSGIWHTGGGGASTTVTNTGILRKTGDSFSNLYRVDTTSSGMVEILAGTLQFETSNFNNHGQVNILEGSLKLNSGSGIGNGCYFIAEDGQLVLTGNYSLTCQEGSLINGVGSIQLSTGGGLNSSGSENGLSIDDTIHINQAGGNLGGVGKLYFNGVHNWTEGNCIVGTYYFGEDGLMTISGSETKRLSGTFHNYGTIQMSGSLGGGNLNLYNYEDAKILIVGSLAVWHTGGGSAYPYLHNYGLLQKSGAESATCDVMYLNNYGQIYLLEGNLAFYCPSNANYNQAGSGALYHLAGKMVFRYGNLGVNNVNIILDGTLAEIRDHNNDNILATCTGTGATGSFTLLNSANLSTNSNFNNSGTLDLGTGSLLGQGNFTGTANSSLILGSPDGITLSEATGNIQKSGSRIYSSSANYCYKSDVAQDAGDGLPHTVRSLVVENPEGLNIGSALVVTQALSLVDGAVKVPNLTLGSGSSTGSLQHENGYVVGDFCHWLETTATEVLFPVGTPNQYRPVSLSFMEEHTSGGSLALSTIYTRPGSFGLPLSDAEENIDNIGAEAYWKLTPSDGLQTGNYNINILASGYDGINDYSGLHLLQRTDSESPWLANGIHIPCSGSNEAPMIARSGLNSFGEYGLGSTSVNFISLGIVQNLQISLAEEGVILVWTPDPAATFYKVYATDDPYAAFPEAWTVVADDLEVSQWTDLLPLIQRRFYIVIGTD